MKFHRRDFFFDFIIKAVEMNLALILKSNIAIKSYVTLTRLSNERVIRNLN